MSHRPGDRVLVAMPDGGDRAGVVEGEYRPGLLLVRVEDGYLATIIVDPHRLRPDAVARPRGP